MGIPIKIVLVEDAGYDADLILRALKQGGYEPIATRVDTPQSLRAALAEGAWDAILCDHSMRGFTSQEAMDIVQRSGLDLPFLIVSGTIGEEVAISMMRHGAHDYILKGNLSRLAAALERELEHAAGRRARREAEEIIHRLAFFDTVTGIPNRASLNVALAGAIDRTGSGQSAFALLVVGLHRFREINTTLGSSNGDLILQRTAERLATLVAGASLFRVESSKFALLCPTTDESRALAIGAAVVRSFQAPVVVGGIPIEIGASVGIALGSGEGDEPDQLLRRADIALHAALHRVEPALIYRQELESWDPRRLALMGALRVGIDDDQLRLVYQPKVDMRTSRAVGAEALLRWRHPEFGDVRPDEFIPLAEESALIRPLTRWVVDQAIRQCMVWRRSGMAINVAINLSARNLEDPDLAPRIECVLREWNVSPSWITFEITESSIMGQTGQSLATLDALRAQGVALSIDDFGTGYSSLAYLRRLPVSEVKIDRSFVVGLSSQQGDLSIVRTVIDLGHHLGLKVVAEGVEDPRTWDLLAEAGCDLAQGYYMARPMSPPDFERWASQRSEYGVVESEKDDEEQEGDSWLDTQAPDFRRSGRT